MLRLINHSWNGIIKYLFPLDVKIKIFINSTDISPKTFKKMICENLLDQYPDLVLFGSIVYDPENARDIDIYGPFHHLEYFKNTLKKYFVIHGANVALTRFSFR